MTGYVITMQPPMLPPGEYTYKCTDDEHLRRTARALKTLNVEIIDVETEDGSSLLIHQWKELVGE